MVLSRLFLLSLGLTLTLTFTNAQTPEEIHLGFKAAKQVEFYPKSDLLAFTVGKKNKTLSIWSSCCDTIRAFQDQSH